MKRLLLIQPWKAENFWQPLELSILSFRYKKWRDFSWKQLLFKVGGGEKGKSRNDSEEQKVKDKWNIKENASDGGLKNC